MEPKTVRSARLPPAVARFVGMALLALGGTLRIVAVWFLLQPGTWNPRIMGLPPLYLVVFAALMLALGLAIERDGRASRKVAAPAPDAAAPPEPKLPTLSQPVESTRLPASFARVFGLACLLAGGVLIVLALVVFMRDELFRFSPLNLGLGGFVLVGFGVAIDRDRWKDQKSAQPPTLSKVSSDGPAEKR